MELKPLKILVLATIVVLALTTYLVIKYSQENLPLAISLQTDHQPTIGYPKAPVHVVVFEEPKCPDCKQYNNTIFPLIKKDFIETNKILYTVIPVSFLPNSMPAAIALLCVYNQELEYPNKDLFFKYLDYLYQNQPLENIDWATDETLEQFAQAASPAINLDRLKNCVDKEGYRIQIEKNTKYGSLVMDGQLSTPTIYVDGMKIEDVTYSDMSRLIKSALRKKGERG